MYRSLCESRGAHANLGARKQWAEWRDEILADLEVAHPSLRGATTRLDVRLIGHAMARPVPGAIWGASRAAAARSRPLDGRVHFAHSDLSALPLFEEAVHWGLRVAGEVNLALPPRPHD